jgi:hypothetical protein
LATILKTAMAVKSTLDIHEIKYNIRVYSEGKSEDFAELAPLSAEFFIGADAIWTLQELVEADILIMAKSGFSTYAALISDGIKLYETEPFESPWLASPSIAWVRLFPDEDWLPLQPDGSFDHAAFKRRLSVLMRGKAQRSSGMETSPVA